MKGNHEGSGAVWVKQKQEVQECSAANPATADSKATPAPEMNKERYITLILYLFSIRKEEYYKINEENLCLGVQMRDASGSSQWRHTEAQSGTGLILEIFIK